MQSQPHVGMIGPSPGAVSAANRTPSLPSLLLLCSEYRVRSVPSHVPSPLNPVPEPVQNASPELPLATPAGAASWLELITRIAEMLR